MITEQLADPQVDVPSKVYGGTDALQERQKERKKERHQGKREVFAEREQVLELELGTKPEDRREGGRGERRERREGTIEPQEG